MQQRREDHFVITEGTGPLVEPLPFSKSEYERRLSSLREAMTQNGLDAFLSFTPENLLYYGARHPGYYFYQACIVTATELPINVLRRIETTNTLWRSWSRRVVTYEDRQDPVEATLAALDELGVLSKRRWAGGREFFLLRNDILRFARASNIGAEKPLMLNLWNHFG